MKTKRTRLMISADECLAGVLDQVADDHPELKMEVVGTGCGSAEYEITAKNVAAGRQALKRAIAKIVSRWDLVTADELYGAGISTAEIEDYWEEIGDKGRKALLKETGSWYDKEERDNSVQQMEGSQKDVIISAISRRLVERQREWDAEGKECLERGRK